MNIKHKERRRQIQRNNTRRKQNILLPQWRTR